MSEGRQAVGHPVDVGSGAVFTKRRDVHIQGTMPLEWVRHYATDCETDSWLGRGWTVPFFMRLEHSTDGFTLVGETGNRLLFPAPGGELGYDRPVVLFGANMELRRMADRIEILHWHVASPDVVRFVFLSNLGGVMPLAWVENLAGHRLIVQYDDRQRPRKIVQELEGRALDLIYDQDDLIVAIRTIDSLGQVQNSVHFVYDQLRRLIASVDRLGHECRYGYDDQNRLVLETNPLGSAFHFRYDPQGRCVHAFGDGGYMERRLQYSTSPAVTRVADSLGNKTEYWLNPAGQVVQEVSPTGAVTVTEYDAHGRIVRVVRSDSSSIAYQYDERGNRQKFVDEEGGVSVLEHNELHLLTAFTDAAGSTWRFEYDRRGNLTALVNALGARWECDRDDRGLVVAARHPGGLVLTRRYGPDFAWMEEADQLSLRFRLEFDGEGRRTSAYDARGLVHRLTYDSLGRPVHVVDSIGRTTELRYSPNSDVIGRLLPGGQEERWDYDSFGRMIGHHNAAGSMRFEYDSEDRLVCVTNRAGEVLTREFDADGRMIAEKGFDGRIDRFEYNLRGFRTRRILNDGRTVDMKYGPAGNLVARTSSDGLAESFAYDVNGRLVAAFSGDASLQLIRDPLGRVFTEVQERHHVSYEYDADNNCVARRIDDLDTTALGLRFDVRGRLVQVEDARGVCQSLSWNTTDQLVERLMAGGGEERFSYDDARRLHRHEVRSSTGNIVWQSTREYDERDNVVLERRLGSSRQFRYDGINRLLEVRHSGGSVEFYRYDAAGTIVETHNGRRTLAPGGRTLADGTRTFQYGADGSIFAIVEGGVRYELGHSVDGKLRSVRRPDGELVEYGYDALGRRTSTVTGESRIDYVWQSCDLAAEAIDGTVQRMFLHHQQAPLAQWSDRGRQAPVVDQVGLPHLLVDDRGNATWSADYEAFGAVTRIAPAPGTPFRFRGQYHDGSTGFTYNFARHYDGRLAGYLAPDPIGLIGGSNFYLYPRNPLLWDDPFGLTCTTKHKGQMGEAEMDAHYAALGYSKLGSHDAPHGGGPGRPQGIDGVYHNPNGHPPYIIAEAKFGSAGLGTTVHSGQQMSNQWIHSPIGGNGPSRLEQAVGPAHAAAIQNSATTNPGTVSREVFHLPNPGTPGTGSVTQTAPYNPASTSTTF